MDAGHKVAHAIRGGEEAAVGVTPGGVLVVSDRPVDARCGRGDGVACSRCGTAQHRPGFVLSVTTCSSLPGLARRSPGVAEPTPTLPSSPCRVAARHLGGQALDDPGVLEGGNHWVELWGAPDVPAALERVNSGFVG